ncbi:hypothetical protein GGS26DRAFT_321794 [Hypomontagnella submonticulosa]|nr:hypothetical protein GGS26DRAFT_321794 [Hypomontagnella submonticulosa]
MVLAPLTTTATPTAAALAARATSKSLDHDGTPPVAALTTVWTPSEGCWPLSTRSTTDIDMFWTSSPECAPPGYASYFDTYYYSPAICPSGYTVGCSRYGEFQGPSVEPTETAMLCVLSDYSCTPDAWNYYATNTDLDYAQVMIQIRWASSDLSILETHPLTPGLILATGGGDTDSSPTGSPTGSSDGTGLAQPTGTSDESRGQGGLSTGAQVGIGVGVGLFGLLAIGLAVFFILWYRKKRSKGPDANKPATTQPQPPPGQYPVHQYPYMSGPGGQQGQTPQGYSQPMYPGYTQYVDPKTGAVTYYSSVPHPTELGGTAVTSSAPTQSQGAPSVVGSQPTHARDSTVSGSQPMPPQVPPGVVPVAGHNAAEMPGNEGVTRSVGSGSSPQAQQEMAHLMAEQAKLDARRTRLMELAELDEEEERIRTRMQQIQQTQ